MNHWTEGLEPDAEDSLVRPFTITRGRTSSRRRDLALITVVMSAVAGDEEPRPGLEPEHRKILAQCRAPSVVAEVAAALDLPVSVTKILIADLIDSGLLTSRAPAQGTRGGWDMNLLKAVRDGLEQL